MFKISFAEGWDRYYSKMDKTQKEKIWKKIQALKTIKEARHLMHGLPCFVLEAGQYRICFKEEQETRKVIFVGNHKQYKKWYKQ